MSKRKNKTIGKIAKVSVAILLVMISFVALLTATKRLLKKEEPSSSSGVVIPLPDESGEDTTTDSSGGAVEREQHAIAYKMVVNGEDAEEIYDFLYQDEETYPTSYNCGAMPTIPSLYGEMLPVSWDGLQAYIGSPAVDPSDSDIEYLFYGWYLDEECSLPLAEGEWLCGDITLYAKIQKDVDAWTDFY